MTSEQIAVATQKFIEKGGEIKYYEERKTYSYNDILDVIERVCEKAAYTKNTKKTKGKKK